MPDHLRHDAPIVYNLETTFAKGTEGMRTSLVIDTLILICVTMDNIIFYCARNEFTKAIISISEKFWLHI